LIIDSDEPSVKLARTVLEADGWRVTDAPGGELSHALLAASRPDLIIWALGPPIEIGLKAVRETCALVRGVPIVAVTALNGPESEHRMLRAGCAGYISKPIDVSTFSSQLRAYLGAHR
jgi:DNA-binding response OmpR family regulator